MDKKQHNVVDRLADDELLRPFRFTLINNKGGILK